MFTARPLTPVGRPDGQTLIGLANFDAVCHPVYGTSLVDGRYQPSGLITAHEIAHVLGAPHDGEGDCVGTPATYLMAPILNYSHEFSQCSIQQMSNALGRAACLKALSPGQTEVAIRDDGLPNSVLLGDDILFGFTIENLGTETAFNVTVELDGVGVEPESLGWLPGFECETPLASFPWRCWAIAVRPSSSAGVIGGMIRAVATQPGTATLNATVSAANDTDRSNNAVQVEIEVIPAVELAFSEPEITASVLRPGQYAEASIVLTNRGRVDATNVDLHITDIHGNLELEPRVVGGSPCTVVAWKEWSCPIDILAAGDHRLIELGIHVREDVEVAPGEWFWASVGLFVSAEQMHPGVSNGHWFRLPIARNVADIKVSVIPPADATKETETEASVVIENLGPDTAIDIHLSYYDTLARIDGADGIGTCEFFDPTLNCRIASLEPGQSATVTVRSRAPDESSSEIEVGAWTGSYDPEIANNEAAVQYPIKPSPSKEPPPAPPTPPAPSKPPQTSSGGGGGGAFDALTLMALAGLLMRHRARLRSDDRQKLARKPAQAR
ncbi:MAG: hypothetical protein WBE98_01160 [Gammaproteobacteria bacterium]